MRAGGGRVPGRQPRASSFRPARRGLGLTWGGRGGQQSLTRRRVTPLCEFASTLPSSDRDPSPSDLTLTCLLISAKTLFLNEVALWGPGCTWLLGDSGQPGDTAVTQEWRSVWESGTCRRAAA